MLIGGGVAALALVVLAVVLLSGSSGGNSATQSANTGTITVAKSGSKHHAKSSAPAKPHAQAPPPAETTVAVLNGTETTGLAHHVSEELQQSGYSQATPLEGKPPGANSVTVVEYASGQQAAAEGVARSIPGAQVQPLETAVAPLAGSSKVVVIVGANTAQKVQ